MSDWGYYPSGLPGPVRSPVTLAFATGPGSPNNSPGATTSVPPIYPAPLDGDVFEAQFFAGTITLASPNGYASGFTADTVSIQIMQTWNKENAWIGIGAIGWGIGWPVPPGRGFFPNTYVAEFLPQGWQNPFLPTFEGTLLFTGHDNGTPFFSDLPTVKQLLIGVNTIALPTGLAPQAIRDVTGTWTTAPQYYLATGLRIAEFGAFDGGVTSVLSSSPFFYPGDAQITLVDGGSIVSGSGSNDTNFYQWSYSGSPSVPTGNGLWTTNAYTFQNQVADYVVDAQSTPDPTWQRPRMLPAFAPQPTVADYYAAMVTPGMPPPSGNPDYSNVGLRPLGWQVYLPGRLIQNSWFMDSSTLLNGSYFYHPWNLVVGSYKTPHTRIPMTGTKNYTLYLK